jgi:hypothetical protein
VKSAKTQYQPKDKNCAEVQFRCSQMNPEKVPSIMQGYQNDPYQQQHFKKKAWFLLLPL